MISIAFEESEWDSEVGRCQKQRLVDILLQVMLSGTESEIDISQFSAHQVGYLASFLARQLAKPDNKVIVSRDVFSKVLVILTKPGPAAGQLEERQQAVLDIIQERVENRISFSKLERSPLITECEITLQPASSLRDGCFPNLI